MPKVRKQKAKTKFFSIASDLDLFIRLEWAAIFILVLILIFNLLAQKSLRQQYQLSVFESERSQVVLESMNYHGLQSPSNFPVSLLRGKIGNFLSSQEHKLAGEAALQFVSFESLASVSELGSYYASYLKQQAFSITALSSSFLSARLYGSRSTMSFDVNVQPSKKGSLVSIYYRLPSVQVPSISHQPID